ncbi:MAG: DUF4912 domain-containing protein [Candidatus Omnitrophica bacterium]|nr:DUF4912 domain-containing protein [Candidatus Omnitrophota bacterium]
MPKKKISKSASAPEDTPPKKTKTTVKAAAAAGARTKDLAAKKSPDSQSLNLYSSTDALQKASLPESYYQTYVTLLSKEPYVLYAYWEIAGDDIARLREEIGPEAEQGAYTLRVYDVTLVDFDGTNANYWFDLDELFMNNRYIHVGSDDATYVCEIGMRLPSGQFKALARSNYIRAQRAGASQRRDVIWKEIEESNQPQNMYVNVRLFNRQLRGRLKPRSNWMMDGSRMILRDDDIRAYYQRRVPMMKIFMERLSSEERLSLEKLAAGQIGFQQTPDTGGVVSRTSERVTFLGATDQFFRETDKKEFPFELKMTLTVTGKTEPDADVYLGNKKIELDEKGEFTLTWTLDDGVLPMDFRAWSPKKELGKTIESSVIRTPTESREL